MIKSVLKFARIPLGVALITGIVWLSACSNDPEDVDVDCNLSTLSISIDNTTNPGCNLSNGNITVAGSGGGGSYTYSIDGVNFSSSANFTNLAAGSYTITVRDNHECTASLQATLSSASNVSMTSAVVDAGCGTSNGSITITATGGEAPYTYRLNQASFQSSNVFSSLANGTFTVTVRDNNGCESVENIIVTSGLSLASDIKPIIETNCAISNCHVGGALPDFRVSATIVANAANIRNNTQNKTMPPADSGITLTDDQIQKIACWVNDGAPNN
jgi:hypothetical protein